MPKSAIFRLEYFTVEPPLNNDVGVLAVGLVNGDDHTVGKANDAFTATKNGLVRRADSIGARGVLHVCPSILDDKDVDLFLLVARSDLNAYRLGQEIGAVYRTVHRYGHHVTFCSEKEEGKAKKRYGGKQYDDEDQVIFEFTPDAVCGGRIVVMTIHTKGFPQLPREDRGRILA